MKITFRVIALGAAILAGCGGGGSADVVAVQAAPQFIVWVGSAGGNHVIDGSGHDFAFYSDTGCLYNSQTGHENTAFCLLPGNNIVA